MNASGMGVDFMMCKPIVTDLVVLRLPRTKSVTRAAAALVSRKPARHTTGTTLLLGMGLGCLAFELYGGGVYGVSGSC